MRTNKLPVFFLAVLPLAVSADSKPDLRWFIGHWCAESGGEFVEEQWMEARGDIMLGLSRTVKGAKTASFEYLRIEWTAGVPSYVAQPQGHPPVAFRLTASGPDWARFENPAHDFPKRVEYRRTQRGLRAVIAGPGKDGKDMEIPFDYGTCAR